MIILTEKVVLTLLAFGKSHIKQHCTSLLTGSSFIPCTNRKHWDNEGRCSVTSPHYPSGSNDCFNCCYLAQPAVKIWLVLLNGSFFPSFFLN